VVSTATFPHHATPVVTHVQETATTAKNLLARTHAAPAAQPMQVTVVAGDTLSGIAGKDCGNPADWTGIAAVNKLGNPDLILPGQRFTLNCTQVALAAAAPTRAPATGQVTTDHDGDHDGDWSDAPRVTQVTSGGGYKAVTPAKVTYASVGAGTLSFTQIENLWVSAGGPAWAEVQSATVAECESGGRTNAYNPSGASGIWQILGAVVPGNLFDPFINAENAVAKFKASGGTWAQWVCRA
jgi:LysM repeat protein